jgi:glycosyltransferase involved in cell wall biosynthesis/UDP-N-acetyl-D-mannosaminuronic acid transferase (WecB/TagA/CpsF family)
MISVIILTRNEQKDLPGCLAALHWCDDIHVVDSGSTDDTTSLARRAGAHVYEHPFSSFGTQRNWALDHCAIKNGWILFLDADEVANPEFVAALQAAAASAPTSTAGFYCCWKLIWDGRWLKRCDSFPKWQFRLLRQGRARFTDFGHGQKEADVDGVLDYLRTPYDHYGLSKGWGNWLDRHNRYATLEAAARLSTPIVWSKIFSRHGSTRNQALKPLVSRMPGWPILRFCITYFLKLGFREGRPGFVYCANLAYYEFLIRLKMREKKLQAPTAVAAASAPPEAPARQNYFQHILGIRFFVGGADEAIEIALRGGLVVVPAAPALVDLKTNVDYREALANADLAITDSGLMVLLWRILSGKRISRLSGLKYLKCLLDKKVLQPPASVLWIMPNAAARDQNLAWLRSQGYQFNDSECYLAPNYPAGPIADAELLALAARLKPRHVVVCLGGGTQERLGWMLKRECGFTTSIHCVGAAIGFLTGHQVRIPMWADKLFLGWFFRCWSEPTKFVPRYWRAVQLVPMMIRYRENSPARRLPEGAV